MKFIKYILIALLFFVQPICFGVAEKQTSTTATETTEVVEAKKDLSEEELHQLKQAELDKEMVAKIDQIRSRLKSFIKWVHGYSPSTAKMLVERYWGITVIQYLVSFLILLLGYSITKYGLSFIFKKLLAIFEKRGKHSFATLFISKIKMPINVVAWVIAMYYMVAFLIKEPHLIAIMARALGIIFWGAGCWAMMIVSDSLFGSIEAKFRKKSSGATASLLSFINRVVKIVIIVIAILSTLAHCGINVNTIVASLGIGGMALAFASQDTIANFFGSVSIILDRPFIVGDWVKTNACEGNVEAIGFRSTRIRTFSKTLVTIPNSTLAKESVENFTKMPQRKVSQVIGVTYSTTSAQIKKLLVDLRKAIAQVDGVIKDSVFVEFDEFGASSLDVKIIYYTRQIDYGYYSATKRRVNLVIMDIVAENGLSFAFPSVSLYVEADATKQS